PENPGDDCSGGGHGTHVAGIVGGDASANIADGAGFLYGLGMAPKYSIFAQNTVCGSFWPPIGGWQEHSKWAVLAGAVGGNNSWTTAEGVRHGYQSSERVHDFITRDANFDTPGQAEPYVQVFSVGNMGPSASTITAPKEAKNIIVVSSSQNHRAGDIDSISFFSSRGPAADGRWVPTVAAPGSQIASTRNDLGGTCASPIPDTAELYAYCSGTSMAAPHASGALVLITDWWRRHNAGTDPSPAMSKALLVNGAVDMNVPDIPNADEGWGRINVANVVNNQVGRLYFDQAHVFDQSGDTWSFRVGPAEPTEPLKVTLAWSDAPGAVGANPALVNDLDLIVVDGEHIYRGNAFSGGWSIDAGPIDSLNNLENVYLQQPGDTLSITVRATSIAGDGVPANENPTDQDFALVCHNCVEVVTTPELSISKTVTPSLNIDDRSELTYTIVLSNGGEVNANGVMLTDTLPISTTFLRWVKQNGAGIDQEPLPEVITWTGTVTAQTALTFSFVVSYTGEPGEVVTNTVEYAHDSGSGSDNSTVIVKPSQTIEPSRTLLPLIMR
ncbi:MAG: S8 family serine peptidase, partial [Anaerolineae bacterium]|nr:S8 family serine peptidase [Anaerolineae bacterium]